MPYLASVILRLEQRELASCEHCTLHGVLTTAIWGSKHVRFYDAIKMCMARHIWSLLHHTYAGFGLCRASLVRSDCIAVS